MLKSVFFAIFRGQGISPAGAGLFPISLGFALASRGHIPSRLRRGGAITNKKAQSSELVALFFAIAERWGFEPQNPRWGINGFRDRRFRPLSHLSRFLLCKGNKLYLKNAISRRDNMKASGWLLCHETVNDISALAGGSGGAGGELAEARGTGGEGAQAAVGRRN